MPGLGDLFGPPPVEVDTEPGLTGAAGDPGGDVQHPVAERRDLGGGEVWFEAKPRSLVQATRSIAVITISSQALLAA